MHVSTRKIVLLVGKKAKTKNKNNVAPRSGAPNWVLCHMKVASECFGSGT